MYLSLYDNVSFNPGDEQSLNGFVQDALDLGTVLNVPPYKITYCKKFKDNVIYRVNVGDDRVTWGSKEPLKSIQDKLSLLMRKQYNYLPTDHILSYIPKKDYKKILKEEAGNWDFLMQLDIKKYFDNISFGKIFESLQNLGFSKPGSKLITQLLTIKKDPTKNFAYLQQGSSTAPIIANIVGYYKIDEPIQELLTSYKNSNYFVDFKYLRYSDNVYVLFKGPIKQELYIELKNTIKTTLWSNKFKTHNWSFISRKSPNRPMKMLGIVINEQTKMQTSQFESIRAALFNILTKDSEVEMVKYCRKKGVPLEAPEDVPVYRRYVLGKFWNHIKGKINYINDINEKQGAQLKKLLKAIQERIDRELRKDCAGSLPEEFFVNCKQYTKSEESVDEYWERLQAV